MKKNTIFKKKNLKINGIKNVISMTSLLTVINFIF